MSMLLLMYAIFLISANDKKNWNLGVQMVGYPLPGYSKNTLILMKIYLPFYLDALWLWSLIKTLSYPRAKYHSKLQYSKQNIWTQDYPILIW